MQKYELYHLAGRTHDRNPFKIPLYKLWDISILSLANPQLKLKIHAYVLMPNHFHLLAEMKSLDLAIEGVGHLNLAYKKIQTAYLYRETYRYIVLNPVRARLCNEPDHYPYSSFSGKNLPFLLHSKLSVGFGGKEGERLWIMRKV
ncbi:MAG: hypothetical protein ACOYL6_08765 [Bacteriovoracaceae bacterium]